MGTRSLTIVHEESVGRLCVMYRQMDGYPTGHGQDLKTFAGDMVIANGLSWTDPPKVANGMRCLAAQLFAHFKNDSEVGGIYLYPTTTKDAGQEYEYHLSRNEKNMLNLMVIGLAGKRTVLYDGPLNAFDPQAIEEA